MGIPIPKVDSFSYLGERRYLAQWAGIKAQGKSPHSPTVLDVKSTPLRATAKLTRPRSKLLVTDSGSLGNLTPRLAQNKKNTMMSICLEKSLTADTQARLITYRNKYAFDGVEYTPLIYKIFIRLATIDSVTTTQTLRNNLQLLGVNAVTVNCNIDKLHS